MKRRLLTAGTTLAVLGGMLGGFAGQANAVPPPAKPAPTPLAAAVSAADLAASAGLDALAKGPDESYERRNVTQFLNGLYSVSYERSYKGLPVVGGDAVVLADGQGKVRGVQNAASGPVGVPTKAKVGAAAAE